VSAELKVKPTREFPAYATPMVVFRTSLSKKPLSLGRKQRTGRENIFGLDSINVVSLDAETLLSPLAQTVGRDSSLLNQQAMVVICRSNVEVRGDEPL